MEREEFSKKVLEYLRAKLVRDNVDAYLITKSRNVHYVTGFCEYAVLYISAQKTILIIGFNDMSQAVKETRLFEVLQQKGDVYPMIAELAAADGVSRIGFDASSMTYDVYLKYSNALKDVEMVPVKDIVEDQRAIKQEFEIDFIKKAAECGDKAFDHILGFIKPGMSENEIVAELEYTMRRNGASRTSFDSIVGSGENSATPHAIPSQRKVRAGDAIVLDFGALRNGYCSDMTRTVFVGKPIDDELIRIYRLVSDAQKRALEYAWSGRSGAEIDEIARAIIRNAGYGENYGHGLGHGVGMEVHEMPSLSSRSQDIMEDGMVVTIEPGIYIAGKGGVRIEDMIVINGREPIVMTHSSKEMIIL